MGPGKDVLYIFLGYGPHLSYQVQSPHEKITHIKIILLFLLKTKFKMDSWCLQRPVRANPLVLYKIVEYVVKVSLSKKLQKHISYQWYCFQSLDKHQTKSNWSLSHLGTILFYKIIKIILFIKSILRCIKMYYTFFRSIIHFNSLKRKYKELHPPPPSTLYLNQIGFYITYYWLYKN